MAHWSIQPEDVHEREKSWSKLFQKLY